MSVSVSPFEKPTQRFALRGTEIYFRPEVPVSRPPPLYQRMNPSRCLTTDKNSLAKALGVFMRFTIVTAAACMGVVGLTSAADADAAIRQPTLIPEQALESALQTLATTREMRLIFASDDVQGRIGSTVSGNLTLDEALRLLLKGTNLKYRVLGGTTISIYPAVSHANPGDAPVSMMPRSGDETTVIRSSAAVASPMGERTARGFGGRFRLAQAEPVESGAGGLPGVVLEEVRVTASRREENLQDVALAVTVLDQEQLARGGRNSLPEILPFVPGVTVSQFGANYFNDVYIRGINATVVAGVGTYVDDIPYNSSTRYAGGGAPVDATLLDLDYVNVMKGPQGTLYGASAMGGILQFKTRAPSLQHWSASTSMDISSTRGAGISQLYRATANGPIVQDKVALGVAGFWKDKAGYIDNVVLGRTWDDSEYYGGSLSILAEPVENLTLKLLAMYQSSEQQGLATIQANGRDNFPAVGLPQGQPIRGKYATGENVLNPSVFESKLFGLTAEYDFGPATLTSVTSYQELERVQLLDFTVQFAGLADQLFPERAPHVSSVLNGALGWDKVIQELRLTSASNGKFEWIVGGFYSKEEGFNVQDLKFVPAEPTFYYANFPSIYQEQALFGTATYFFTPRLDASIGIRRSDTESSLELDNNGTLLINAIPLNVIKDEITTYLMNVRYRPSDNLSFYARAASGYRPGGANFLVVDPVTGAPLSNPAYLPDELWSYEAGIKGTSFDRRLSYDVTAFFIDWSDYQIGVARGGLGVAANAEEASSRGVEVSLSLLATDALKFTAALSYIDAKLDVDEPELGGRKGTQLPSSPKWSGALGVNYNFMLGTLPAYVGGSWLYTGQVPYGFSGYTDRDGVFHGSGNPRYVEDSYSILDLQAGLITERFEASVYVKNALGEYGYSTFTPNLTASSLAVPLVPRTVGIMLRVNFN